LFEGSAFRILCKWLLNYILVADKNYATSFAQTRQGTFSPEGG
jgi:hypothetical protein